MIRVSVSREYLPDPAAVDEFNQHAQYGVAFERYDGPHTVPLPDFDEPLTRMVYEGLAHSFMPPRAYPHEVLCAIRLDSPAELQVTDAHFWPLRWIDGGRVRIPHRSVTILEFDRAILYVIPGRISRLMEVDFRPMIEQLQSAQSELRGAMSSFGGLGYLAEALAGPICLHFTLLDGKPILIGTGPHYTRLHEK
jgi:hypothetical protein